MIVFLSSDADLLYWKVSEPRYQAGRPVGWEVGGAANNEVAQDCAVLSGP